MLDETKIERTGDVLEWLFRSAMKVIWHLLKDATKAVYKSLKQIMFFDVFSLNGYQPF